MSQLKYERMRAMIQSAIQTDEAELGKPEQFYIAINENGRTYYGIVEGQEVFEFNGFRFFITDHQDHYRVSCVLSGVLLAKSEDPDEAAYIALAKIEINFDRYLRQVKKAKKHYLDTKVKK